MTDNNVTEIVLLLDESGSMTRLWNDSVEQVNKLLEKQRETLGNDKVIVSLVGFNQDREVVWNRKNLEEIPPLRVGNFKPHGNTALYDAIGFSIRYIRRKHANMLLQDVPHKTIFVVITDGFENSSRYYTRTFLKEMITLQKLRGWEFVYLSADENAILEANSIGVERTRISRWYRNSGSIAGMYANLDRYITSSRKREEYIWDDPSEEGAQK